MSLFGGNCSFFLTPADCGPAVERPSSSRRHPSPRESPQPPPCSIHPAHRSTSRLLTHRALRQATSFRTLELELLLETFVCACPIGKPSSTFAGICARSAP